MKSLRKQMDLALKEMDSLSSDLNQLKMALYNQNTNPQEQIQKATRPKGQLVQMDTFRKKR